MKILKEIVTLLFYFILVIAGSGALVFIGYNVVDFFIPDKEKYVVTNDWVDTIGVVSDIKVGASPEPDFTYWYHDKKYEGGTHRNFSSVGIVIGDKYKIKINPKYPECYVPISWMPVFEDDEKRVRVVGSIYGIVRHVPSWWPWKIDKSDSKFQVLFRYKINSDEFERGQYMPPDFDGSNDDIKVGNTYEVEVSEAMHGRAIICLDKPIKE